MNTLLFWLIKPIVVLLVFGLILLPARLLAQRLPEGKIKRLLLRRV